MIRFENTEVYGWEAAIRGMRNPKNSWDKSDTTFELAGHADTKRWTVEAKIGENDLKLMKILANAGNDHGKFLRMIGVSVDIVAPLYWVSEHDTYKVGTVRNSCSFMHRGTAKPFEIRDFSVSDERVYDVLSPLPTRRYHLKYPYETREYKLYETKNGRKYKIYKNGKVFRCEFEYTDNWGSGRTRKFEESECKPSKNSSGYYELRLGGRIGEKWLLHRLIASCWVDNPNNYETVNHIDGDKGNNSAENLEWVSREENIKKGFDDGLYKNIGSLHCKYIKWKNGSKNGIPLNEYDNENYELFILCDAWEKTIDLLNSLRQEYLDTKDESIFQLIRQTLPCGYNVRYTWSANYAVLRNIYHSRKNHRLPEWHAFCDWIKTLPYANELICD